MNGDPFLEAVERIKIPKHLLGDSSDDAEEENYLSSRLKPCVKLSAWDLEDLANMPDERRRTHSDYQHLLTCQICLEAAHSLHSNLYCDAISEEVSPE